MGTWGLPRNKREKKALFNKFLKLRKLQEQIIGVFGDDILLDNFEGALDRLATVCTHITPECKHPAYYMTEQGYAPGVCSLCRSNEIPDWEETLLEADESSQND